MVTLLKLSYFLEAAKDCNFSEAAKRLFTTQPSVSKQIALLEKELGTELSIRGKQRLSLTRAGSYLYDELKNLPEKVRATCDQAAAIGRQERGCISIGIFRRVAGYSVQMAILDYAKQRPELSFETERDDYSSLCKGLLESRYDMIITDEVDLPVFEGQFSRRKLFNTPLALIVSTESHLAGRESISLSEMENEPFVVQVPREVGSCSDQIEALFKRAGFKPRIARTVYSLESLFLYTSLNEGAAMVDENNGVISSPNLTMVRLDPPVSLPIYALWNENVNSTTAKDITDWIIRAAGKSE